MGLYGNHFQTWSLLEWEFYLVGTLNTCTIVLLYINLLSKGADRQAMISCCYVSMQWSVFLSFQASARDEILASGGSLSHHHGGTHAFVQCVGVHGLLFSLYYPLISNTGLNNGPNCLVCLTTRMANNYPHLDICGQLVVYFGSEDTLSIFLP